VCPGAGLPPPWLRIHRKKPHLPHQRLDPLAVDPLAFPGQPVSNAAAAQRGALQMDLVDPSRQGQIRLRDSLRPVVDRGSVHLEQFVLLLHRQSVRPVDHASALRGGYRPSLALGVGEWFLLVRFIFCSSSLWSLLQKTPLRKPLPVSSQGGPPRAPLAEIPPGLVHPVLGKTIKELLEEQSCKA
jgi:hypothetical protein